MVKDSLLSIIALILLCSACGAPTQYQIDLGKAKPERLLKFYFGGYGSDRGEDPLASGLLIERDGVYYLDTAKLPADLTAKIDDVNGDGVLEWDELEPFLQETYYPARSLPGTLDALAGETDYRDNTNWQEVEIDGVMTVARRRIYIHRDAIRSALANFEVNGRTLLYPVGTTIVGEHWDRGQHVETTVMRKRGDNFWDFFVYDESGRLASSTSTPPKKLQVPTRCVGCHFGGKKFEPENSFPFPPTPGPDGPRGMYVDAAPRDSAFVSLLDEHNKRSDTILGVYATIYLSQLQASLNRGEEVAAADRFILERYGM